MLDTMYICHAIWSRDREYVREYGIQRCWRKDNILLASWNADIENEAGSASVPERDKKITDEDCMKIFTLLKNIHVQVEENDIDTNAVGYGLNRYFVEEADTNNMNDSEWEEMSRNCIYIEEDPDIEEDDLEDSYKEMEHDCALMHNNDNDEDLPPPNREKITITYLIATEALATLQ